VTHSSVGDRVCFENGIPLRNAGVIRGTVLRLHLRSRVAAVSKSKHEVGAWVLLAFDRRNFGERKWLVRQIVRTLPTKKRRASAQSSVLQQLQTGAILTAYNSRVKEKREKHGNLHRLDSQDNRSQNR